MGLIVRDIPTELADDLPSHLRHAGFSVKVYCKSHPRFAEIAITRVECQRGEDVQFLFWEPIPHKPGEYRIYILKKWSLWTSVSHRRTLLRDDVIAVIEQSGGYLPSW